MAEQDTNETYLVLGSRPWNRRIFKRTIAAYPGQWHFISEPEELTLERVRELDPRYIFFLHWSWIVPDELTADFNCVCFHMTDVPFGRGGSPLQNLIVRGHRRTKLTALRMSSGLDAGPVYLKRELSLEGSTAEEIYIRAAELSARMIRRIIDEQPEPQPQQGEPVEFKRRKRRDSEIPQLDGLDELHDFIRMLDADGYPAAFLNHQGHRYQFRRAARYDGRIVAEVTITPQRKRKTK